MTMPAAQPKTVEVAILKLIASGVSNREIARRLDRAEQTVNNRVVRMKQATGAADRTELVVIALRRGWLGLDELQGDATHDA